MDPTKNYIKLAGQPVQEIENVDLTDVTMSPGRLRLCFNPIPPPEKSLAAEILEKLHQEEEEAQRRFVKENPDKGYCARHGEMVLSPELRVALEIIDRKLKALKG